MRTIKKRLLLAGAAGVIGCNLVIGLGFARAGSAGTDGKVATSTAPGDVKVNPERDAYFGDLHLHTTNSFDAYTLIGTRTTPDEAYRFARGETINFLGQPVHRAVPLDFMAVTDHSENLGVFNQLDDPNSELSHTDIGKLARSSDMSKFLAAFNDVRDKAFLGNNARAVSESAWRRSIEASNANYRPGRFTTFIAYEWTSMPGNQNLHRNVIFRGADAPYPFTRIDSGNPRDLWLWLSKIRGHGYDALAISHNANASNGLMYDWNTLDGRPIDEAYAQLHAMNEPDAEIVQTKGSSETHPLLSANDEFAGFEIWDKMLLGGKDSRKPGSYWRDGLGRGLVIGAKIGVNPFKDGAVGASDIHTGVSVSSENDTVGGGTNLGGGRKTEAEIETMLGLKGASSPTSTPAIVAGSAGLTGVWAVSNTREAIFDALRRKETFATSGTRLKVRFFGGWNLTPALLKKPDWVKTAYAAGVPMGGDLPLPTGKTLSFAVQAVKDPDSGNLDRIQIIKVWLENGAQHEHVFDVAWSGNRRIDPATGKLPAVGNTVDLKTGRYANSSGAAQLATLWSDPMFRADQPAVYYVRVLEIPTPRWTTLRAIENGLPLAKNAPATIQERAWSSPIWYTPKARG